MHGHDLKPSHIAFESGTRVVRRPFLSLFLSVYPSVYPPLSLAPCVCSNSGLDKERRGEEERGRERDGSSTGTLL